MIYFQLFGPLSILLPGQQEPVYRFRTRATGALLGFLACHPGIPHEREALIETFWPNQPLATGRNNLSLALSFLRRTLGEPPLEGGLETGGSVGPLRTDRHTIVLDPEYFETDVTRFEHALEAAAAAALDPAASPPAIHAHLNRAILLYRGDLLNTFDEEWILGERLRLRERYLFALREMVTRNVAMGNISGALDAAHRAVAAEPGHELHHLALMELYLQAGQPERAVRQFQHLRRLLRRLDGSEPTPQARLLSRMARQEMRLPRRTPVVAPSPPPHLPDTASDSRDISLQAVALLPPAAAETPLLPEPRLLPLPRTRFFGRQREYGQVLHWLDRAGERLATLIGPGGIGKTRLAQEIIARSRRDGLPAPPEWFVPLADVTDAAGLTDALETTLGQPGGTGDLTTCLRACAGFLGQWPSALLLLDGPDRLLQSDAGAHAVAAAITTLLGEVPALRCLVTSRQPLGMAGERRIPLGPLGGAAPPDSPLPPYGTEEEAPEQQPTAPRAAANTAPPPSREPDAALFLDRVRSVSPDLHMTRGDAPVIATLCRRLGGNPLAIEMAAAWAAELTYEQMLQMLTEAPERLLSARGCRDLPPRHRSLEACFVWSYEGLAPPLQRLLRRLTVFSGPFPAEAVVAVCADPEDEGADRCLEQLTALCERSQLVMVPPPPAARREPVRFAIPEVVRFCVRERFVRECGPAEQEEIQRRFVAYYLSVAENTAPHLLAWEAPHHLRRLDAKQINLRAALATCIRESRTVSEDAGHASFLDLGLRLCLALRRYWMIRGHATEGLCHLSDLLSLTGEADIAAVAPSATTAALRRDALLAAVDMASRCRRPREALAYASHALASGSPGDVSAAAKAVAALCALRMSRDDIPPPHIADVLRLALKVEDVERQADLLEQIGELAGERGEGILPSLLALQSSLSIRQQIDDMYGVARLLAALGCRYLPLGYTAAAESLFRESAVVSERLDDGIGAAVALRGLASAARLRGRFSEATDLLRRSSRLLDGLGIDGEYAESLRELAMIADAEGQRERAMNLAEEALRLRYRSGAAPADLAALHLLRGDLRRQEGDTLAATVELRQAERLLGASGSPARQAGLFLLRGRLLAATPRADRHPIVPEALQCALVMAAQASRLDLAIEAAETLGSVAAASASGTASVAGGLALLAASSALREAVRWPRSPQVTDVCAVAETAARGAGMAASTADAQRQRGAAMGAAAAAALRPDDDSVMEWLRFDVARWADPLLPAGAAALREGSPQGDALIHAAERGESACTAEGGLLALNEIIQLAQDVGP